MLLFQFRAAADENPFVILATEPFRITGVLDLIGRWTMDEQRTLALLGWGIGGIVGTMFLLNALALASLSTASTPRGSRLISQAGRPIVTAVSFAAAKAGGG
jgi:hypothetical protein